MNANLAIVYHVWRRYLRDQDSDGFVERVPRAYIFVRFISTRAKKDREVKDARTCAKLCSLQQYARGTVVYRMLIIYLWQALEPASASINDSNEESTNARRLPAALQAFSLRQRGARRVATPLSTRTVCKNCWKQYI